MRGPAPSPAGRPSATPPAWQASELANRVTLGAGARPRAAGPANVSKPFADKSWLAILVEEALVLHASSAGHSGIAPELTPAGQPLDFASAARVLVARSLRARRPPPAQPDGVETFRESVVQHVHLLLDLRQLHRASADAGRSRAEVAGFLAGALGENKLALAAANHSPSRAHDRAVQRALAAAGKRLHARFFPPGDPRLGVPMNSGNVAVFRRHLARVTGGFARSGRLEPEALERHAVYAARELVLLAEALSGLLHTAEKPDRRARWVRSRQMVRLGLRGTDLRAARRGVARPRTPEELALASPELVRGFLFEQLLLAQLRTRLPGEGAARFVEAFGQAASLDPQVVVAAQLEAAAQSGDPQAWFEGFDQGAPDWHGLAEDWGAAADQVVDRFSTAITQNLGALVTEIRETGELGTLLGKAAAGQRLSSEEKRKVRGQLVDLAKAVPALAIFAAPGGALLLPILVKLLPFNLLPSAWDKVGERAPGAALPAAESPAPEVEDGRTGETAVAPKGSTKPAA